MQELPNPGRAAADPDRGWLAPSDAYLRSLLRLPELAIVEESSAAERALHEALRNDPRLPVGPERLATLGDDDVRANYEMFLGYRDALLAAGTLEAYYLALVRSGRVNVPPVFVDRTIEAIVRGLVDRGADPFERRASQLLYRVQRISLSEGRVLAADHEVLDGLGEPPVDVIGSLLAQGKPPLAASLPVLNLDNAPAPGDDERERAFILDLTHEVTSEVGNHGLAFTMTRAHSGLSALARVLERWILHMLDVKTSIRPLQRIDDPAWVWHVGLDPESSLLLNDLYRGEVVDDTRLHRLVGLFRLDFLEPADMRAEIAGKPVYLGLAMSEALSLRVKAQNLLVSLPLASGA